MVRKVKDRKESDLLVTGKKMFYSFDDLPSEEAIRAAGYSPAWEKKLLEKRAKILASKE